MNSEQVCILIRIDPSLPSFVFYLNTFWFVGVTMCTVGYGDYYPSTSAGKILSFIICIWGLFFISLGFVSLINLLKLSLKEQDAINIVKKLKIFKNYKSQSALIIVKFFQIIKLKKIKDKSVL